MEERSSRKSSRAGERQSPPLPRAASPRQRNTIDRHVISLTAYKVLKKVPWRARRSHFLSEEFEIKDAVYSVRVPMHDCCRCWPTAGPSRATESGNDRGSASGAERGRFDWMECARRKPAGIGIGIGRSRCSAAGSVWFGSKAIQGKRPRALPALHSSVEEARLSTTLLQSMYVYYPSPPFARSSRRARSSVLCDKFTPIRIFRVLLESRFRGPSVP